MEEVGYMGYVGALKSMEQGFVVAYQGSSNTVADRKTNFAMFRGVIHHKNSEGKWMEGGMVYCQSFRYKETGEIIDSKYWPGGKNVQP